MAKIDAEHAYDYEGDTSRFALLQMMMSQQVGPGELSAGQERALSVMQVVHKNQVKKALGLPEDAVL